MTVLALESDPAQAATVRHIVCDLVGAKLTLVQSIDHAVQALQTDTPDLIVLHALVSPAEEAELLTSLSTRPNSAHVEILITPALGVPEESATVTPRGWRRWGTRRLSTAPRSFDELDLFAERLRWSLERARQRQQHTEGCDAPNTAAADRPNRVAGDPDLNALQSNDTARPLPVPVGESSRPHFERVDATVAEAKTMWPPEDFEAVRLLPAGDDPGSLNVTRDAYEPPVDQATEVVADTSSPERQLPDTTTASEPGPCLVDGLWTNRRAHRRFPARELLGLRSARIKLGPLVSLVNLSAGGALFETEARLRPESEAVLELAGDLRRIIVPFRVVRCHVSTLNGSLRYRGACDFTRELDLADLVLPSAVAAMADTPIDPPERVDVALKAILEPYLRPADGGAVTLSLSRRQVTELVKSLQTISHRLSVDPMAWAIHDVLALVTSALPHDEGSVAWISVEAHLRNVLRGLTAGSADAPACVPPLDTEALYFQVPTRRGEARRVLNVAIPQGGMLEDWQFRLPKASTWLAALPGTTRERGGTGGPGGRAERRHHVRVNGPFDGRRHGAIDTPVLIHNLSEGGCFMDSLFQAEAGRQLSLGVSVPGEGWITVKGEVVHGQLGFGFAVRFVEMPDATSACLARMVARRTGSVAPDIVPEQMTACNAW